MKRIKYCVRGLAFASATREWFAFLQTPEMAFIVKNNPCLYHKLQRPYLNRTLNTAGRLATLKEHYQFIISYFPVSLIEEVHVFPGKLLVELALEKAGRLELRLTSCGMQKEGDLMIFLSEGDSGRRIATLSFSFCKCGENDKEIFIGGLQGDKATSEDQVVTITRGLYGLRPKALLFYALQQLAASWGITRLWAVSDDMHIYRHYQTRRNVAASYDEFWAECGGVRSTNGFFDLPVAFVPREISTIRVNKRQMYRRRYAMLEKMAEQIRDYISGREFSREEALVNAA